MNHSDYYIGVDIGTTSTKAVAFDAMGLILAKQSSGYPILHPQQNQSEQNPEVILQAVVYCLSELAKQLSTSKPVLVSFSAAMHSLILMDENNQPLTGSIIWADNRASELAAALKQTDDGKNYYHVTGVPVHAMSPLCKLLWLKENDAGTFTRAKKFIGIKEFIFYRLFEKYIVDTAIASATGLLNINTLHWDAAILSTAGIDEKRLSQVVPVTHVEYLPADNSDNLTNTLQAFLKTAFVVGSSDGALANLGSGATSKGSMAITIGTSSAARITTRKPATDSNMRSFCYHLCGEQYIIGGASNNGAIVLQWLKEKLLQDQSTYDAFISQAATVAPGSDELLLLPYILGERAPVWNADARGVYFGLDIKHTTAHLVRAAMESVVYNVYTICKILMAQSVIDIIYVTGGFTESELWVQMLADMFNLPVMVCAAEESAALGAVMIGLMALQLPDINSVQPGKVYIPDPANHSVYVRQCAKMERIYALLEHEF